MRPLFLLADVIRDIRTDPNRTFTSRCTTGEYPVASNRYRVLLFLILLISCYRVSATGCSIVVVYAHGVGKVRVRFPAARHVVASSQRSEAAVFLLGFFACTHLGLHDRRTCHSRHSTRAPYRSLFRNYTNRHHHRYSSGAYGILARHFL